MRFTTKRTGAPVFRGHVREPRVQDFEHIAQDIGLTPRVIGQNFLGQSSNNPLVRCLARVGGPLLERRPALCSDLYLVGQKP